MRQDAGMVYEIRFRFCGRLVHHHWKPGRPFTPIQEDAPIPDGGHAKADKLPEVA
jgi:hypothetical protein